MWRMCEKCATCKYYKCIPATYDEPSEDYCTEDMDEFYEEEEVECPKYDEAMTEEDWEAYRYNWDDYADKWRPY